MSTKEQSKINTFGKVAVLYGGTSAERDISLQSGQAVLQALLETGIDAVALDARDDIVANLKNVDRVFIALHGRGGEDGSMQGLLEVLGLPYTGSGVMASALSMDKVRCKYLWLGEKLPTPGFMVIESAHQLASLEKIKKFPVMVKPAREGSSVGISKVDNAKDLESAVRLALQYDVALVEEYIQGSEYTVAILGDTVLPPIRLDTPRSFYDFQAKYLSDETRYTCPCGLNPPDEQRLKDLAFAAFKSVGASGWGRVDVMRDKNGMFYLLEINTVPGMTSHSLVPMAAKHHGLTFNQLVIAILQSSCVNKENYTVMDVPTC